MRQADTGNKAELRGKLDRHHIDEQQARIEIAGRRGPASSVPAAPAGLSPRDEPAPVETANARGGHRCVIGRADRLEGEDLEAVAKSGFGKLKRFGVTQDQNSDLAAAAAAVTNGPG